MDLFLNIPTWALNTCIVLGGALIALVILQGKRRVLFAILALMCGFLWHFIRGYKQYTDLTCNFNADDGWLIIFNKCVPHLDTDIVIAQVMVLAGVFSLAVIIYKKCDEKYNDEELS